MATFYYNRFSSENINSQWIKHLQSKSYVGQIENIVSQNSRELQSTIQNASSEQAKALQQVCGKLEDGFSQVNQHLKEINFNISGLRGEINEMASMLDWKLSLVIEEQRLTNQLLGQIATLLRIPDSQKQRVYYIEQGLKYLKNAIIEGIDSAFYIDSLESFKEAEKIERKDYITLNKIGQIYLYSEKHLNFSLAEEYFLKSAREAFAESNAGGTTTSNNLRIYELHQLTLNQHSFKIATAESYIYASRACYLQEKFSKASEYAGKAYNLVPEFLEAGFEQAKYLAANNQETEATNILKNIINKDRFFSLKTLSDQDLSSKKAILQVLEEFQKNTILEAESQIEKCKSILNPRSKAKPILRAIDNLILQNNFLSGMKALDLLNKSYIHPVKNAIGEITTPALTIYDFIIKENKNLHKYLLRNNYDIKTERHDNITGEMWLGIFIGFFKGCTFSKFEMNWVTFFMTIIICGGIGAFIGVIGSSGGNRNLVEEYWS